MAHDRRPSRPSAPTDTPDLDVRGVRIPEDWCRLCWRDTFVERDGQKWLEHIGPLAGCTHVCHDETFMGSTS